MKQRATSADAKAGRRDAILDAAAEAFDRLGFQETSMAWLAAQAGVAKGTTYLYFPSKEAVFLALTVRELDAWFELAGRGLNGQAKDELARIAGLLVDALDARPRLPPLLSMLHTVLERNVDEPTLLAFRQHFMASLATTGGLLERKLTFLQDGDGVRLLLRLHALIIGCWHVAAPAPLARRALQHETLVALRIDFSEELENSLVLLLEGWRRDGGGF